MISLFPNMPEWASYLVAGLTIFAMMAFGCVIATRAGRSPYWGGVVSVRFMAPVLIWLLACTRWPALDQPQPKQDATDTSNTSVTPEN